jgi:hypothetical protein
MSNYITIEDAATYFATRLHTIPWTSATSANKTKALTMATRAIDALNYRGAKADSGQDNQFPRGDDSEVPAAVKEACCEIALALLDGIDPDMEFSTLRVVSQGISSVRTTYDSTVSCEHLAAGIPSITAWRLLRPYLRDIRTVDISRV